MAILAALTAKSSEGAVNFPKSYAAFLRTSMCPQRHRIREIKGRSASATDSDAAKRFDALLKTLASDVPPIALPVAEELGLIADSLLTNVQPAADSDVAAHFATSSSTPRVGRLISCIVRTMRSKECLELGTAYGMSALYILDMVKNNGGGRLTTVEAFEPQFTQASRMLEQRHGDAVRAHKGWTAEVLPALVPTLAPIDFLFHDAGHSRKDYLDDFALIEPILAPGAVMLMDDIRWNDQRYFNGDPQTYAGWRDVVANERVERAVEVGNGMGLLLVR
jgi:predicted O-methyltransferase YrrM